MNIYLENLANVPTVQEVGVARGMNQLIRLARADANPADCGTLLRHSDAICRTVRESDGDSSFPTSRRFLSGGLMQSKQYGMVAITVATAQRWGWCDCRGRHPERR